MYEATICASNHKQTAWERLWDLYLESEMYAEVLNTLSTVLLEKTKSHIHDDLHCFEFDFLISVSCVEENILVKMISKYHPNFLRICHEHGLKFTLNKHGLTES